MKGLRIFVVGQVAAWCVIAGLFVYVTDRFEDQREHDCEQTLDDRAAAVEAEVATWRDVEDIVGADPRFDRLEERIRARAETLPPPADCE